MPSRAGPRRPVAPRLAVLRFWLADHAAPLGLVLTLLLLFTLVAIGLLVFDPLQPSLPTVGVVRSITRTDLRSAPRSLALVDVEGHVAMVGLPWPTDCALGRPIRLMKRRRPWGGVVVAAPLPCPQPAAARPRPQD